MADLSVTEPARGGPEPELVRFEVADGVATITLNSPANRNALSAAVRAALTTALTVAAADPAARVVVLGHDGPVFCSGMDLKEEAVAAPGREGVRELPAILQLISGCPKPVVAAVRGPARAGGIGLLAASDIVVAAPAATFAFSEVRVGVIPAVLSVPVLHRVAPAAARELFLTGEVFGAERALQIGLVNAVDDDVDGAVARFVRALQSGGPHALAGTKALLRRGVDDSDGRYAELLKLSAAQFATDEAKEGARAFAEKRPARWVSLSG
jgi:methylglutaconyl-CoA hydratase